MTRRRALSLAALFVALAAYGATARHLPELPEGLSVAFLCAVVLPVFAATVWLALPLASADVRVLLGLTVAAGALAVVLSLFGVDSVANVTKLATYALLGFAFLSFFEELWWVALVAILVPWVDIWSVVAGPTEYVIEEQPGIFQRVSITLPGLGDVLAVNIGPPDVVFFALFLAAAVRFGLRVGWTWVGMTVCLAATLALVWAWDDVAGLPALPAICFGFLLPNAELLWQSARRARAGTG